MRAFLITILVVVALGFYQHWLHPGANKGNTKERTGQTKERLQGLARIEEPTSGALGDEMTLGWVKKVESTDHYFLMLTVDNEKLTVHTDPSTMFKLNGREITLADLEVGDQVRVAYDVKDGKITAASITVDRR